MTDLERLDQRLAAVERVVVDGDVELDGLADLATLTADIDRLETRVEDYEQRLAALEATVDAVSGFVGNVESVDEDVERQAAAAVAAVDRLEYRIDELERALPTHRSRNDDVATGETVGTESPRPSGASIDDRIDEPPATAATSESNTDPTAFTAETGAGDTPFGAPADVESTAETLLEPPDERTADGDAGGQSAGGLPVQQTVGHQSSSTDDEAGNTLSSGDTPSPSDDDASRGTATDGDDSNTLIASLRAKFL
ncbi:hypothetical protein [Natronorubrum sp. A-ect3]|uniref:DUF7310 family coiled-coil domain-containing protein n=1 Tax=Natronorubrum sp. A-ect3 TaxID=3242698 RepID=UPI00359D5844